MPAGCFQTTRQPEAVVAVAVAVEAAVLAVVVMDWVGILQGTRYHLYLAI